MIMLIVAIVIALLLVRLFSAMAGPVILVLVCLWFWHEARTWWHGPEPVAISSNQ